MRIRPPSHVTWLTAGAGAVLTLLDQLTKHLASSHLDPYHPIVIIEGFFQLTLVHNPGAAFGLFRGFPETWRLLFFSIMYILAVGILINLYMQRPLQNRIIPISISLIGGGALGNFIDRYRFGYVIDFIDTYPFGYHFPTFNIADSCITIGVSLMILHMLFFDKDHQHAS
ncbi:signal peptidase II [bacterium]|nr:signal peptidase II [candidate division CSSED10-310 bacterium]